MDSEKTEIMYTLAYNGALIINCTISQEFGAISQEFGDCLKVVGTLDGSTVG